MTVRLQKGEYGITYYKKGTGVKVYHSCIDCSAECRFLETREDNLAAALTTLEFMLENYFTYREANL